MFQKCHVTICSELQRIYQVGVQSCTINIRKARRIFFNEWRMKRLKLLCVQLFRRPTEALLCYGNGVQAIEQASYAISWRCDRHSLLVASSEWPLPFCLKSSSRLCVLLFVANKSWWWFCLKQGFNLVSNMCVLEYILISWTSEYSRGFCLFFCLFFFLFFLFDMHKAYLGLGTDFQRHTDKKKKHKILLTYICFLKFILTPFKAFSHLVVCSCL